MNKKDLINVLIVSIIFQIPVILVAVVGGAERGDLTVLFPGNFLVDSLYFFILSPLLMILFIQIFSVILANAFFKLHNIIKMKRFDYAIFKTDEIELHFKDILLRAVILGLFAVSIGTIMTNYINPDLIIAYSKNLGAQYSFYILMATLFVVPYLIFLLLPIWLLKDSGVMCSRKRYKEGALIKLPDVEGVFRLYNGYVMGYIGISAILAITLIIYTDAMALIGTSNQGLIVATFFVPLASIGVSLIPIAFYVSRVKNLKEKFLKKLTAKGLKTVDNIEAI